MTYSPLMPVLSATYFHEENNSSYDIESSLFNSFLRESQKLHGVQIEYLVTDMNTTAPLNVIFAEDRTERKIVRKFTLQTYLELPQEKYNINIFGMGFLDNIVINLEKEHFTEGSKYNSKGTSAIYDPLTSPFEGDLIYTSFDNTIWEIISVRQASHQFLKRQHNWTLECKPIRNQQLSTSATLTSGAENDILESMITDIFNVSAASQELAPDVLYEPGITEESIPKNTTFGDW